MPAPGLHHLISELRRRRVFRVVVIYLVGAWGAIQVADTLVPRLGLPDALVGAVIVLAACGLPLVLVLAWVYDLTATGIARTGTAEGNEVPARGNEALATGPVWTASRIAAVGIVMVLAGIMGIVMFWTARRGSTVPGRQTAEGEPVLQPLPRDNLVRKRVLIAPFENQTGDANLDFLGSMAAEYITEGLTETGRVDVVDPMTVLSSSIGDTSRGAAKVDQMARELGAGTVVSGTYYLAGDSLRFDAKVLDESAHNVLRAVPTVVGSISDEATVVKKLGEQVTTALAIAFDSELAAWTASSFNSGAPPSIEAYKEYHQGIERYRQQDWVPARQHFERASAADSNFVIPLIWAGVAAEHTADFASTDSLARVADKRAVSAVDRNWTDWLRADVDGDREGGREAAERLVRLAPSNELAQLQLGFKCVQAGHVSEGLTALREHVNPESITGNWPNYWYFYTMAYHLLGDHQNELLAGRSARSHLDDAVAALGYEARALAALDREDDLNAIVDSALALAPTRTEVPGDVANLAGIEERIHGHPDVARRLFQRALDWTDAQDAGFSGEEPARRLRAFLLLHLGRLREAQQAFQSLADEYPDRFAYPGELGVIAARRGDRAMAKRMSAELERMKRPYSFGAPALYEADIAAALGQNDHAVQLLRRALNEGYGFQNLHGDLDLLPLQGYPAYEELVRPRE